MQEALEYASANEGKFVESLKDILRIPSVSTDPAYKDEVYRCALWVSDHLRTVGFPTVKVYESAEGYHPVVYAEWIVDPKLPTVLSYGHYDVQPADPEKENWETSPFEPVIRDGKIYARGANDNKGQFMAHVNAVEAYVKTHGAPPVNVKMLIEGEEESGGAHLEVFVPEHKEMLSADVVCVSDCDIGTVEVPCLTYGLRGIVLFEVTVRVAEQDMHSGVYGGAVLNPFHLLAAFITETTGNDAYIAVPEFYDHVRKPTEQEKKLMGETQFDQAGFRDSAGIFFLDPLGSPGGVDVQENIGFSPTCDVHGMPGGYTGAGGKTVIPAEASVKMSMRLVPDQDPKKITENFKKWAREQLAEWSWEPGVVAKVEVKELGSGMWWRADASNPVYEKARKALMAGFGAKNTGTLYEGGTIPVVPLLADTLKCPMVLMGLGLHTDGLHAPNEHFGLNRYFGGTRTMIHFYNELAKS